MSHQLNKIFRNISLGILCAFISTVNYAQSDMSISKATSPLLQTSSDTANTTDSFSVHLGKYHLVIPREYFGRGIFSIQTTNHLVLDVQLPDIRPMTENERDQFAKTGRLLPNTAHIIIEENDRYVFGDQLFERSIMNEVTKTPPFHYLSAEQSNQPDMLVYHNKRFARDIYLVKYSSPKFFFDCAMPNKFIVNPDCKYYGHLIGDVRFQIWYNKNHYFKDIPTLTPKIKALLVSFLKP